MKLRATRILLAVCSGACAVLMAVVALERTSPGPLAAVHQREPDLAGKSDCSACHGGLFSDMTEACLDCHAAIASDIEKAHGLHGALGTKAERCAACHSEHHGAGFQIVNVQSFVQAGFPAALEFDHAFVGFVMEGKHLEQKCVDCHPNANVAVLEKGEQRYLGRDQSCVTCHEDPHEGRMKVACDACHAQEAFDRLGSKGHERFLELTGAHADVACLECHSEDGPWSLEILGTGQGRTNPRRCQDCHESPHEASFVDAVARASERHPSASCVVCHEAEHATFRDERLAVVVTAELHAHSGFPLAAPHAEVSCGECHAVGAEDFGARYPGRGADECQVCHEDPHGGQFVEGPFAGGGCLACHAREHFVPHEFDAEDHALARLPLDGAHLDTACEDCHLVEKEGEPRVFRGTSDLCAECHADAHLGFFEPFSADLEPLEHGECARCHATASFAELPDECFEHARWTGFEIRGAHEQEGCEACHPSSPEPDVTARSFGRVAQHFGPFTGCETCHADPHRGEFDADSLPRLLDGRAGCTRCHAEVSFRSFPYGFEHGVWTSFALAGAHAEAECSACHAQLRRSDEHGRTWKRAAGSGCPISGKPSASFTSATRRKSAR